MTSALIFSVIFVGVAIAVYQVYDIYYSQNFDDDERQSQGKSPLARLSSEVEHYTHSGQSQGLTTLVDQLFSPDVDRRLLLSAASRPHAIRYLGALLRRQQRLVAKDPLKVRHPLAGETAPPARDSRPLLLSIVVVNCLLVMFLGGLSLYTIAYHVSVPALAWMNSEWILMLAIYAIVLVTHALSRLDAYLHDLYLIGTLSPKP